MKPFSTELKTIKVNGIKVDAYIQIYCEHSDLSLDDIIGDAEDRDALIQKLDRGDLMIADIRVKAMALGCEGLASLGGCYISSPDDVDSTVNEYGMIQNAIDDLTKTILDQANTLKPFAS